MSFAASRSCPHSVARGPLPPSSKPATLHPWDPSSVRGHISLCLSPEREKALVRDSRAEAGPSHIIRARPPISKSFPSAKSLLQGKVTRSQGRMQTSLGVIILRPGAERGRKSTATAVAAIYFLWCLFRALYKNGPV